MLEPMTLIHIIGHRGRLDATLAALYRLGTVELVDVTDDRGVRLPPLDVDDAHLRELEELRYLRARIDALARLAPVPALPAGTVPADLDVPALRAKLDGIAPEVEQLVGRLDRLEAEAEVLPRHLATLRRLLPLATELTELAGYETLALLIDARHGAVLASLNSALTEALESNVEIISEPVDADTIGALLVFPRDRAETVQAVLGRQQVTRVALPEEFGRLPFQSAITAMERRLVELPAARAAVTDRLDAVLRPHVEWREQRPAVQARIAQLEAIRHLGATPSTFVLSGWVPAARLAAVRTALEAVGPDLVIDEVVPPEGMVPPVLLHNPRPARPFEPLLRLLSVPRYGALDPTTLLMVFLPLFFGMMLGDVVYGLLLAAIAVGVRPGIRRRSRFGADLSVIFISAGLWSAAWGVVYGEFLGDLGHRWFGMRPLWINREEALEPLLLFALAVGACHVTLGLVLGIYEAVRGRDRSRILDRAGLLGALAGILLLALVAVEALPAVVTTPGVAALIVGLVLMMAAGGPTGLITGPLELFGTVGNVLSYLRIAAIGLASVYLARVANELGATGPLWLGLLVATLFHALNLVLGAFSPAIQSLRLHYVEFFGKFYEEGGREFRPFGDDSSSAG